MTSLPIRPRPNPSSSSRKGPLRQGLFDVRLLEKELEHISEIPELLD